jgi:hypothetical protein
MDTYVTLRSTHGILQEVRCFGEKSAAEAYTKSVVESEEFAVKDAGDRPWLGSWGDDDGCGIILALAETE